MKKIKILIIVLNFLLLLYLWYPELSKIGSIGQGHPWLLYIYIIPLFNIFGVFDVWKGCLAIIALLTNSLAFLMLSFLMLWSIIGPEPGFSPQLVLAYAVVIFSEIAIVIRLFKLIRYQKRTS